MQISERRSAAINEFNLIPEEREVLEVYRRAKALKYADINIAIQEGIRVKLWLTEKRK